MDHLTLKDVVERIGRNLTQGGVATDQYTSLWLSELVNNTHNELIARMRDHYQRYFMSFKEYTVDDSQHDTGTLPENCYQRLSVKRFDTQSHQQSAHRLDPIYGTDQIHRYTPGYWCRGNTIDFWGCPSGTWRMYFEREIPELVWGTASGADATTITFPETVSTSQGGRISRTDDYYNDAEIMIISADTNGGRQVATITDYDGSTRVATVGSWAEGTPSGNIVFAILSPLPKTFQSLLISGALIQLGDERHSAQGQIQWDHLYPRFEAWCSSEDQASPIKLIDNEDEFGDGGFIPGTINQY